MPGLRENFDRALTHELQIDQEFAMLIPPLTLDEFSGLEQSIISEGCRDAIIVWDNLIIDGHNRYKICREHNIPYRVEAKDFKSRDEAMLWMLRNQLSRRNLNDFQRVEIVRKFEDVVKAQAKERQGMRNDLEENIVEKFPRSSKSRDELGIMAGVSGKTYEHAIEVLEKAPEIISDAVRQNELSINAAYEVTKMSQAKQDEISEHIKNGERARNVISKVKKSGKTDKKTENRKSLTLYPTAEDLEQIYILAEINKTDINTMSLKLIRVALNQDENREAIRKHKRKIKSSL